MDRRLRVAIVDDEELARARLRRLLVAHSEVAAVEEFDHGDDLLVRVAASAFDAVFLDIGMPERDGLEIAAQLPPATRAVFVTAYPEHALRAFDLAAVDYLVKPVLPERLAETLARLGAAPAPAAAVSVFPARIPISLGRRVELVEAVRIDSVIAQANYIDIRVGARTFVLRCPLHKFARGLDPALFQRVHRSIVVRLEAVAHIEPLPAGRYRLRLKDGSLLVSGRSYRQQVRRAFGLTA